MNPGYDVGRKCCSLKNDRPVLLFLKKSLFEVYGIENRDSHFLALMRAESDLSQSLKRAHDENLRARDKMEDCLQRLGLVYIKSDVMSRQLGDGASLVISLGGDGTLLMASHGVKSTPVLGINSRPGVSVGHFCAGDVKTFPRVLDAVFSGVHPILELNRLDLFINGERKLPPALNDALFCAISPGSSSVYSLSHEGEVELHKSSGIWFATAAGSTAGIHSAGGYAMKLEDRHLQFRVREPYRSTPVIRSCNVGDARRTAPGKGRYSGTFVDDLEVINLTPEAAVYVDGSRICWQLQYGDAVAPRISVDPLRIFHKGR